MNNGDYYDGTKLLSMMDIDGNKPEIYLCTSNRTGGKTTYFSRMVVNRFFKRGDKFMLLLRFNYELDGVADAFFKDIGLLFFDGYFMRAEKRVKGLYYDLYICDKRVVEDKGKHCGYAVALNSADAVKKRSHLFSDVQSILFDEFQSETNTYCQDEVSKFISIHTSVARGRGEMTRYVPVYMVSNPVSLINPYYSKLKISYRLRSDTKFLRGKGFVLEQGFNSIASEAMKGSGFSKAFADDKYIAYAAENVYLNDNMSFIEPPEGRGKYVATIKYMDKCYAIRSYAEKGVMYCDSRADETFPFRVSVTTDDHEINYVMLKQNDFFIAGLRKFFSKGCFRFRTLEAKEALMTLISMV